MTIEQVMFVAVVLAFALKPPWRLRALATFIVAAFTIG